MQSKDQKEDLKIQNETEEKWYKPTVKKVWQSQREQTLQEVRANGSTAWIIEEGVPISLFSPNSSAGFD